ncbi:polysaccharide pyruvyl transferase family protein [bacterium]|nr:polysaccharide pyruvyl transferase family protein [bacterium]
MNKNVLQFGFYGGNIGDDLLMTIIADELTVKGYDVTVVANIRGTTLKNNYKIIQSPVLSPYFHLDYLKFVSIVRKCDLVILGGGGVFQDTHSESSICLVGLVILTAKIFNKPVIALGNGLGPFKSLKNHQLSKRLLDYVDQIFVRDSYSLNLLSNKAQAKAKVIYDPVWWIKQHKLQNVRKISMVPVIGITLREWPSINEGDICNNLQEISKKLSAEIALIPFEFSEKVGGDRKYLDRIKQRLISMKVPVKEISFASFPSFTEVSEAISQCDLFLSMRFHGVILSILLDVPVGAIACSPKITSLMNDNNLNEYRIGITDIENNGLAAFTEQMFKNLEKVKLKQCILKNTAAHAVIEQKKEIWSDVDVSMGSKRNYSKINSLSLLTYCMGRLNKRLLLRLNVKSELNI